MRFQSIWTSAKIWSGRREIRWIFSGFMFIFSVVFLGGILLYYWPTLNAYPWKLNLWAVIAGCLIYTFDMLLVVLAWKLIMQQLGVSIGFPEHLRIYCLTLVVGRIPGAPWHIAGRAIIYKQKGVSPTVIGVAATLELLLVIVSAFLTGLLIWFALPELIRMRLIWLVPISVLSLGLMHPWVVQKVLKMLGHVDAGARLRYQSMLLLLLLYVVVWFIGGGVLYEVILSVYPLPFAQLLAVVGAWGLSGAIASLAFISPSGFGIREIALSLLLALFVPAGLAVIIAILVRVFLTATEFVWAVVASRF